MSSESLPSGVLKVADLLIEARIEGDSRYTLRTSAVAFARGAEFALNIARRYLASPPPKATGALSERIAILETALTEVLEFQSAHAGPHIFDWGRWRRIRDNTPPFKRAASQEDKQP